MTDTATEKPVTETAVANAATGTQAAPGGQGAAATTTIAGATDAPAQAAPAQAAPPATEAAPTDWRAKYAGTDAEALKRLQRFTDESAFFKSYRSLEGRLSSGEFKKALDKTATPEEVATWRKENGIPESDAGYIEKLALPNGVVLGEADKPIAESFAKAAHANNWSPDQYNQAVDWYFKQQDVIRQQQSETDSVFKQQSEDTLRSDWGQDYRRNVNAVNNLLATAPDGLKGRLLSGRTSDGRLVGNDPDIVRWLAQVELDRNPAATLVPVGTSDAGKSIEAELNAISKLRQENPDKYDADKKLQAREVELIDAQLKMKSRAA